MFAETLAALERRAGGLASFRRLGDHVLIALDGTEYFCSKTIHCPNCSTRLRERSWRITGESRRSNSRNKSQNRL